MPEALSLSGRTALVTGAAGGLGAAMARGLAAAGANVMISDIVPASSCRDLREELARAHHTDIDYHEADLSQTNNVEALITATLGRFGSVDILINNAVVRRSEERRVGKEERNEC